MVAVKINNQNINHKDGLIYADNLNETLDKLLCIIEYNNIKPIICFTKLDLIDEKQKEEIRNIQNYYKKIGYECYMNNELNKITTDLRVSRPEGCHRDSNLPGQPFGFIPLVRFVVLNAW